MKKIVTLMLLVCIFVSIFAVGCGANATQEEQLANELGIECIYFSAGSFWGSYPQYKVALADQKFWIYVRKSREDSRPRDSSQKNEGYYFVKDLDTERIAAFCVACKENGFEEWEESYEQTGIISTDGLHWRVRISYLDGTQKIFQGYETFPKTWYQMDKAFEGLTGSRLLSGAVPEPSFWFFGRPVYW